MSQLAWSKQIFRQLASAGVGEVVVCAGARNAPLVAALSTVQGLRVYSFFEERSAGFFALGRMQSESRPVAVCTTSGTAVAELLPAVIEADYQNLPLIVLSADRPKAYRGTGAPQTINQPGLFSHYVEHAWDLERGEAFEFKVGRRPVHLNICFDEPLLDEPIAPWTLEPGAWEKPPSPTDLVTIAESKPLVILGRLSRAQAQSLVPVLKQWQRPIYAEAQSQLRRSSELRDLEILGGERSLHAMEIDSVVRFGGVPTLRYWRDLERSNIPVFHFSDQTFPGLARKTSVWTLNSALNCTQEFAPWSHEERRVDRLRAENLEHLLREFPHSECAWVRRLSQSIPLDSRVFLGNSLPVREWDLAAAPGTFEVFGNRGTNGIDGLVSTFIGLGDPKRPNWAVLGDLSTLYDLSGPWALRARPIEDINLCVINNGGGKIFRPMFHNPLFENNHDLNFRDWAAMWKWNYNSWLDPRAPLEPRPGPRVIEIVPDERHTAGFLAAWETLK